MSHRTAFHSRIAGVSALLAGAALTLGLGAAPAALGQASQRVVMGHVVTAESQPQPNAVVYLENEKTQEIKTYITPADGSYRFGQLNPDVDYQIWAKYKDAKSKTRGISSFDSRKQFHFELKLSK